MLLSLSYVFVPAILYNATVCDEYDVKPTIFTYNELRNATRDFHPDMKLGEEDMVLFIS
jgi:hypothetical protein